MSLSCMSSSTSLNKGTRIIATKFRMQAKICCYRTQVDMGVATVALGGRMLHTTVVGMDILMIIQDMDIVMITMLMLDEVKDGIEIVANLFKEFGNFNFCSQSQNGAVTGHFHRHSQYS